MIATTGVKIKIGLFATVGAILIFLSLFTFFALPSIITRQIKDRLPLLPGTMTYKNWERVPIPITNEFYFMNITNAADVLNVDVGAKPEFEQVGPYVFRERREKVGIAWSDDETLVKYRQVSRFEFVAEETNGSLDDIIAHVNVPLVSAGSMAGKVEDPEFFYFLINNLATETDSVVFDYHSVRKLLFDGYTDELLENAKAFSPHDRFGFFYGRNGSSTDGIYEVFTGKGDVSKLATLFKWNDKTELDFYEPSSQCNRLRGISTGDFQSPFPSVTPPYIKLFVGSLCRSLKLNFHGHVYHHGIKANRYAIDSTTFNYTQEENRCYCHGGHQCPADGVANTSVCSFDAPIAVSFPHFLHADHSYREKIDGMQPDPDKHTFHIDIVEKLGIAINVKVRMQINVAMQKDRKLGHTGFMKSDQLYLPTIWFAASAALGSDMARPLRILQSLDMYLLIAAGVQLILGLIVLAATFYAYRDVFTLPKPVHV